MAPAPAFRPTRVEGWGGALGCSDFERLDDVIHVPQQHGENGGTSPPLSERSPVLPWRGGGDEEAARSGRGDGRGGIEMSPPPSTTSPARRPEGMLMPKASPMGRRADRRVVPMMQTVGNNDHNHEGTDEDNDDGDVQMARGQTKRPLLAGSLRASSAAAGKAVMDAASARPSLLPPLKLSPPPASNKEVFEGSLRAKHSPEGVGDPDSRTNSRDSNAW